MLEDVSENVLTSSTIQRMYQLVGQAVTDPKFQELVYQITQAVPGKDYSGEVRSIFNWVKSNIKYTRDPYGVELVQDVWSTINRARADCDDFSILIAAMGEVMGNPSRFVTVSTRPDKEPCHVYPELNTRGKWTALDVTVAGSSVGWRPSAGITDRRIWTRQDVGVSGYESATVEGLGMPPFFRSSLSPINLTPDVRNDISHTYADPAAGSQIDMPRPQPGTPRAMVARFSDTTTQPGAGGIPYDGHYPIRSQKSYRDAWSFIARKDVPIHLNAWGYMEPWKTDWSKALPQPNVSEKNLMKNAWSGYAIGMAGLGDADPNEAAAVVSAVAQDTQAKVAAGTIAPSQATAHAAAVVDAVTKGDAVTVSKNPATAATLTAIATKRSARSGSTGSGSENEPSLSWLPKMNGSESGLGEYYSRGVNLGGLGDDAVAAVADAVQKDVTNAVAAGAIAPSDASTAAAKVVDAVQAGDASIVNTTSTPATAAVVKKIKQGSGKARTPATRAHHPVSAGTRRDSSMRAGQNDYWLDDPSLEWNPQLYGLSGLGGLGGRVRAIPVGNGNSNSLYKTVHAHVKRMLPAAARKAGVHPSRIAAVLGRPSRGVSGLGQTQSVTVDPATSSAAAGNITNAIVGVVDPADSAAVAQAVQAGVTAIVGSAAPTSGFSFNLTGWGVPLLVVTAIGGLAYWMTRRKKLSYKRNPSRRRSGGKGGKSSTGTYLLLGGGALAAYMIFKGPATPAAGAPQTLAQKLMSSAMSLFKPTATGAPGAGTAALTSIFGGAATATGKAAAGSPAPSSASTPAPAPTATPQDPFAANQEAVAATTAPPAPVDTSSQDNSMITSLDDNSSS
jgi:antitoxin (DNA-binding transcriptional repressor) of toxin-antitoxin stability system